MNMYNNYLTITNAFSRSFYSWNAWRCFYFYFSKLGISMMTYLQIPFGITNMILHIDLAWFDTFILVLLESVKPEDHHRILEFQEYLVQPLLSRILGFITFWKLLLWFWTTFSAKREGKETIFITCQKYGEN